jgi:hypothetical protein
MVACDALYPPSSPPSPPAPALAGGDWDFGGDYDGAIRHFDEQTQFPYSKLTFQSRCKKLLFTMPTTLEAIGTSYDNVEQVGYFIMIRGRWYLMGTA